MTIFQAYQFAKATLESAGIEDYAFEARQMLRFVTGLTSAQILQSYQTALDEGQEQLLVDLLRRRHDRYPLQYLLGSWSFYGLELAVGEGVLIPRSDTETLVDAALALLKNRPRARILDLCAGSGCVALALAQELPEAAVFALEKEPAALAYLRRNNARYGDRVTVAAADLADPPAGWTGFDCIVCNPPYIPRGDLPGLMPEVRFEPATALDGGADGLDFYRLLCRRWVSRLAPSGWLAVEIGRGQARDVTALFRAAGLDELGGRDDASGIRRVIYGTLPADRACNSGENPVS